MIKALIGMIFLALVTVAAGSGPGKQTVEDLFHYAVLTRMVDGELVSEKLTRDEILEECPKCVNLDGRHYYDTVATASLDIAGACADKVALGTVRRVDESYSSVCEKNAFLWIDNNRSGRARYTISRQADGFHLAMKIRFEFAGKVAGERKTQMLEDLRTCVPKIRKVWSRYRVHFDLSLDSDHWKTPGDPDHEMDLHDSSGRAHDDRLYIWSLPQLKFQQHWAECAKNDVACRKKFRAWAVDMSCLHLLHEIGHKLGLDDEYEDEACPDRAYVSRNKDPYSVMDREQMDWPNIEFFPRHIRRIFKPLCP